MLHLSKVKDIDCENINLVSIVDVDLMFAIWEFIKSHLSQYVISYRVNNEVSSYWM